jgi:hypothetical protein
VARRAPEREDRVDVVGGVPVGHRRVPVWLLLVIVAVVAWGLYYLITYSVTDVGSFPAPAGVVLRPGS